MAEERLIDDDKDRKYKIRKNADGEDELIVDDTPDEDETDIPVFAVPEADDDEEAAVLTPEQFAERQRQREEEERLLNEKIALSVAEARQKLAVGNYEGALFAVNNAAELKSDDGEINCLKLAVLTRNFTDFTAVNDCSEAADGVREYASAEMKAELSKRACGLKKRIAEVKTQAEELKTENEAKKAERREVFAASRKKETIKLVSAGVPFLVLLILAISFASVIFSMENGTFVVLTIVFSALAVIAFVVSVVMLHGFWVAWRNYSLNEKDKSTKLGRRYLEVKNELDKLNNIDSALEG